MELAEAVRAIGPVLNPTTETQHILNDRQRQREEAIIEAASLKPHRPLKRKI